MGTRTNDTSGLWATTAAFAIWGVVPIYWKAVAAIPTSEIIAWRVLWAVPFLALLLKLTKGWRQVWSVLHRPRLLAALALSAALVVFNWFLFIYAVNDGRVMQTSLGYFINPLVNVLLGFALLGERPRRLQWCAIALAALGVAYLIVAVGELPIIALSLAVSFALYGLVRKLLPVDALPGLFIEVLLLLAPAGLWLGLLESRGEVTELDAHLWLLLPLVGLITALPLSLFTYGARRLPLATVGMLQFLAPSGQFLLATLAYEEPFTRAHVVTFGLIWAGVALYLIDLARARRREPRGEAPSAPAR